jgi:hypothetical protein
MRKTALHVSTYNYKFYFIGTSGVQADCPSGFVPIHAAVDVHTYVRPIAKQLRFAIVDAFDFTPLFNYFTNTSIDISVFAPHSAVRPRFTVPVDFLQGTKFGGTHLFNLTLAFAATAVHPVRLSGVTFLDLHNVTIDRTVHDSLEADPNSYAEIELCSVTIRIKSAYVNKFSDCESDRAPIGSHSRRSTKPSTIASSGGLSIAVCRRSTEQSTNCSTFST